MHPSQSSYHPYNRGMWFGHGFHKFSCSAAYRISDKYCRLHVGSGQLHLVSRRPATPGFLALLFLGASGQSS